MRVWILTIFALAIPATGCTGDAATFWEEYSRQQCRFSKKCDKADFNDLYDDMDECKDELSDVCSPGDFEDACEDYDKDEARECLAEKRKQVRRCQSEPNDNDCNFSKICGDDPETVQAVNACIYGSGNDGQDGRPPDATGLWVPGFPELSQLPEDEDDSTEQDEDA